MEVQTEDAPLNGVESSANSTAKSGKKKVKRKNKSKNIGTSSSQEMSLGRENNKLAEVALSPSGKLNGISESDLCEDPVDTVRDKLEKGLKLKGQNGIINGTITSADEHPAEVKSKSSTAKKRHRNRQKSKSQQQLAAASENSSDLAQAKVDAGSSTEQKSEIKSVALIATVPVKEIPLVEEPAKPEIIYQVYESELQMPSIMSLIQKDLSEPYSIYTYRYFIHNWPRLCFLALHQERCVGAIVCKLDIHRQNVRRGYIAMLAVDKDYRKLKIGTTLVQKAIQAMLEDNADEVVLETEITNRPALRLYENLGFVRDKRLFHYYLNGVDALRLKLWFR
ncbi:N-alpha-acetyltransferase 30A-like [Wyeomyia smithii]|uniref:N-alpha-acetyltransferase 30A-like n=1 Tax=Wyeomyia smithii TaxID=174621 RepID=UPI002468185E|nr:N-alpha-acetyltransferase 30A-like [Wyeomyia smithii]